MVTIKYQTTQKIVQTQNNQPSFFLTNTVGGYFFLSKNMSYSHYCGLFLTKKNVDGWSVEKFLSFAGLSKELKEMHVFFHKTKLLYDLDTSVEYSFNQNILDISIQNYTGEFDLLFDCRERYDFESFGKSYSFSYEQGLLLFSFSQDKRDAHYFVAIKTDASFEDKPDWIQQEFELEKIRNTNPQNLWVYNPGIFRITQNAFMHIACGFEKEEVLKSLRNYEQPSDVISNNFSNQESMKIADENILAAYEYSIQSLNDLYQEHHNYCGLYAGLPWFCDFWTRDEAISLGGFVSLKKYDIVKSLLIRSLEEIHTDGRVANRLPHSELGSADGIGWCVRRVYDLIIKNIYSREEMILLREKIVNSIQKIETQYQKENGLIYNRALETWMDTGYPYDVRDGFCIEIQALHAIMLRTVNNLNQRIGDSQHVIFVKKEEDFVLSMQKLITEVVHDRLDEHSQKDLRVRPNVFLAYYIYPWFCDESVWRKTFELCITHLWQNWGGISTISKHDPLYCDLYTGQTNQSYHRGDVWFWLNAVSAMSLHTLGGFELYVQKIIESSTTEILQKGAVGRHAEVSGAKYLSSHGCFMQLWSSACFVELITKIYK